MTILKHNEGVLVEVEISDLDEKYTGTHTIRLTTKAYDDYNKKWLDPRPFHIMLSPEQMRAFGLYLMTVAEHGR